jgi:hypothetical protein
MLDGAFVTNSAILLDGWIPVAIRQQFCGTSRLIANPPTRAT